MHHRYSITDSQMGLIRAFEESNAIEEEWDWKSLNDTISAWNFMMGQDMLSHTAVKTAHEMLMLTRTTIPRSQKGVYRSMDIWIANRKGTHPQMIYGQMEEWIGRQNDMLLIAQEEGAEVEEDAEVETWEATWAQKFMDEHIKYEIIHPFADGNGRTGRLFLNWCRVQIGLPPLVIYADTKYTDYYPIFRGQ